MCAEKGAIEIGEGIIDVSGGSILHTVILDQRDMIEAFCRASHTMEGGITISFTEPLDTRPLFPPSTLQGPVIQGVNGDSFLHRIKERTTFFKNIKIINGLRKFLFKVNNIAIV